MKASWIIGIVALAVAAISLLVLILSGVGHRLHFWEYKAGFTIMTGAVIAAAIALIAALVAAIWAWRSGQQPALIASIAALVVALVVILPPLSWIRAARQLPYIHDITTDTETPPAFVAILKERANAPNTAVYGGPEIAKLQREAYPEIVPLQLHVPRARAFDTALAAARDLGWKIVETDARSGHIEASDQTFWYGFIDDIVVRVAPLSNNETRIDVRSVSRVGKSDLGTNAKRIRKYLDAVAARSAQPTG
jgi:uncharacterized protein (DUF1499 family)